AGRKGHSDRRGVMVVTLEVIRSERRLEEFIKTVVRYFPKSQSDEANRQALESILQAAESSALVGPDMMRAIGRLQREGRIEQGAYPALVGLDATFPQTQQVERRKTR